jgi:hypothetical protein
MPCIKAVSVNTVSGLWKRSTAAPFDNYLTRPGVDKMSYLPYDEFNNSFGAFFPGHATHQ